MRARHLSPRLTAFARRLSGLSARDPSGTPPLAHVLTGAGRGGSTGAQMLLRWSREQGFSGWLAYTLSRSSRRDQPDLAARPADFDQTNVLAAVAGYRRGAWSFGSRGRWATGAPRTPVVGSIYDARADRHAPLFGAVNSMRLAPFFQLDLRAERGFAFRQASLDLYLELLNVTARRNAEELAYNFDYSARANHHRAAVPGRRRRASAFLIDGALGARFSDHSCGRSGRLRSHLD